MAQRLSAFKCFLLGQVIQQKFTCVGGGEFKVVGFKKGREGERRGLVALLVDFKQKANNHAYR